jgi:CRISPR/Cas system CMR subunit Cmr6 (Cas7 group RAMP superfamily)
VVRKIDPIQSRKDFQTSNFVNTISYNNKFIFGVKGRRDLVIWLAMPTGQQSQKRTHQFLNDPTTPGTRVAAGIERTS